MENGHPVIDILLPTYRIEPSESERYSHASQIPSVLYQISQHNIKATLHGYTFCFIRFYPSAAKAIADKIINEELEGRVYDEEESKDLSLNISNRVREAVQGINY